MSALKFPAPLPLPSRADRSIFPALLAALLVLMIVIQFALRDEPEQLLVPGRVVVPRANAVAASAFVADPVITGNPLFAPGRGRGEQAGTGPLDGAVFVGIVRGRGFANAVLQQPDGQAVTVPVGRTYRGWRLVSLVNANATFVRDNAKYRATIARGAIVAERVNQPP